jgi:hypothetical protein
LYSKTLEIRTPRQAKHFPILDMSSFDGVNCFEKSSLGPSSGGGGGGGVCVMCVCFSHDVFILQGF